MATHHLVFFGATGMVGGEALDFALSHPDVARVTTIGRRATGKQHDKLTEVVHGDFSDLSPIASSFEGATGLVFCLGAYTGGVSDELFRRITVDFALEAGRVLREVAPGASYGLLSGQGADREGTARAAFARLKGEAEKGLLDMDFPRIHIFRPGYIYPVVPREEPNFAYTLSRWLWPALRVVAPGMGIPSRELGRAMVHAAMHGTDGHADPTLENKEIQAFVARVGIGA